MPLHSSLPQSDILVARRMVELTCQALEKPKFDPMDIIPLENCFHFLECYRYDAFNWRDAHTGEDTFARAQSVELQAVMRSALQKIGAELFPGHTSERIATRIENALTLHASGRASDLRDAKEFFASLKNELDAILHP